MSTKLNPVRAGTAEKSAIADRQRLVRERPRYRSFPAPTSRAVPAVPKASIAAAALARTESHYADSFPSRGEVVIVCDESEALDLLSYAQQTFRESFSDIREALRKANFHRQK